MMVTVVISHFEFLGIETPNLYASYFHKGSLAVHFVFLMSGFGLTYKYQTTHTPCMERTWTLWRGYKFGMRKMQKLYKWYVLSLLLMLPSTLLILWHTQGITAIPNTCAKFMVSAYLTSKCLKYVEHKLYLQQSVLVFVHPTPSLCAVSLARTP